MSKPPLPDLVGKPSSALHTALAIPLLIFGVLCCSLSVLIIKASGLHPTVLAAYRLLGAAIILSPVFFVELRKHRDKYSLRQLRMSILPAVVLALHIISWTAGAQQTSTANATLIVNMVPVVVPFFLFMLLRERVKPSEIVGTIVALGGVLWLGSADRGLSREHLIGDITCFGSMILFSFYLVQGRLNRDTPSLWLYLVPVYALAGLICLVIASVVADPFGPHPPHAYLMGLASAILPTVIGHSILNYSMQRLSGSVVSVCNLGQFVFAGVLAFLFRHEIPLASFYGAGALVVTGAIIVIRGAATTPVGKRELELEVTEVQAA